MKESFGMRTLLVVLVAFLVTGCATGLKQHADGTWIEALTVADGPDRSGTVFSSYSADGVDKDGKLIGAKLLKPRDISVSQTVVGQATVAVAGGVTTAATQGIFGVAIARENAKAGCKGTTCGNQFLIQGGQGGTAAAMSASNAAADAATRITDGLSCGTNCTGLGE